MNKLLGRCRVDVTLLVKFLAPLSILSAVEWPVGWLSARTAPVDRTVRTGDLTAVCKFVGYPKEDCHSKSSTTSTYPHLLGHNVLLALQALLVEPAGVLSRAIGTIEVDQRVEVGDRKRQH